MKATKKLLAMILSMIMVLAMAAPAFAAEGNYSITITNDESGHTYEAYQVFAGDLSGETLSNVTWGDGVNGDALLTALKADDTIGTSFADCKDAADVAEVLATFSDDSVNLDAFAAVVGDSLSDTKGTSTEGSGSYTISGLAAGYYFVKDADDSVTGNDAYTKFMLNVVKDTTVTPKSDVPESEKKVKDTNDTDGTTTGWQDSADWDIGDKVPFQLKGTVASNYADYDSYTFIFHDKESAGLTFDPDSVVVKVDGVEIESGYEVKSSDLDDDCTFEVVFDDLKDIESVHAGSVITVEYESELNTNAVIGSAGNPNTMRLEFSNNPNDDQEGTPSTGKTPEDTVIVFTYKTVINKIDGENKPLTGAEFTLQKKVKDEEAEGGYRWEDITVVKNEEGTTFTFSGLDDGDYRLTETKTPDGYNTIDPIEFTITAEHDILSANPALTELNCNKVTGEITFTSNTGEGSLTADVVNQSGATLPETGGIGTTIFYIVGGILVVTAGILLITKKRMSINEEK